MTTENGNQQEIAKYRKLFGITESDNLSALKTAYAAIHETIQAQIRSRDTRAVEKGHKNMHMLEKGFTAVASDIRTRERNSRKENYDHNMSIEHASMRVGFQILEGGSKFASKKVTSFGRVPISFKTNNILSASWPAGKLSIHNDYFELACLLGSFKLNFCDIAAIEKAWYIPFGLRFRNNNDQAESVHLFGWSLRKELKDIVRQKRLPLNLNY